MTRLTRPELLAPVLAVAALALCGAGCGGGGLELGAPLPSVTTRNQDGEAVNLAAEGGSGFTLVYFYPAAGSPDCTAQACSLRDRHADLVAAGVRVYGVSVDGPKRLKAWKDELRLPFTLLADTENAVVQAFGVPRPGGFAARRAFLFKDGKLVWKDTSVSPETHAADVLAAVAEVGGGGRA